jgi:pimeloyl-ACP methyl ester carboxylesterase
MRNTNPTVVLVHGGFVDGSGWQPVHDILTSDGFTVAVVQNPTVSLVDDVAAT